MIAEYTTIAGTAIRALSLIYLHRFYELVILIYANWTGKKVHGHLCKADKPAQVLYNNKENICMNPLLFLGYNKCKN